MVDPVCMPKSPALLLVVSREDDGREVQRGSLVADSDQIVQLIGDTCSPLREETLHSVAKVLELHRSQLRLVPAPAADSIIVCA